LPPETLAERLPGISETAKIFAGVDVTKEPAPVLPTVHYNMGGVPTNWKCQVLKGKCNSIVPGLLAAGEAGSASVHGANRLGANSLLDLVVFGRQSADTTAELVAPNSPAVTFPANAGEKTIARLDQIRHCKGSIPTADLRRELQVTMQKLAPVYRNSDDLKKGTEEIPKIMKKYRDVGIVDRGLVWNTDLIEALELENLLIQGKMTVTAAENRKESPVPGEFNPLSDPINQRMAVSATWRVMTAKEMKKRFFLLIIKALSGFLRSSTKRLVFIF